MLNILLPSLPYQRVPDPLWQAEAEEARRHGHTVCLYDQYQHRLYQQPVPTQPSLYRGWMLSAPEYQQLAALTPLLVSAELYCASHQAPGWYEAVAPFTMPSVFTRAAEAAPAVAALLRTQGQCFVKGLSKSFGAASVVGSVDDLSALLRQEGIGADELLFVRAFADLADQPEERYFAVRGEVYGCAGRLFPARLQPVLAQLRARWLYTIDVAYTRQGQPLIIEVGDGQVSDTKEWTPAELYDTVIRRLAQRAARTYLGRFC